MILCLLTATLFTGGQTKEAGKAAVKAGESPPVQFASPQLEQLDLLIGAWTVLENHLNPSGEVVAAVKGTEEIVWILDHRAVRRTYTTSRESSVYRAIGTITWNAAKKKYQSSWFDNVSTAGMTVSEGDWEPETKTFTYQVESTATDGSPVHYRVVERFVDVENRLATTYLVEGSTITKRLEVRYKRTTPCPDRLMIIFDK